MPNMNDYKDKLLSYFKKIPSKVLIIIGAAGVALIALSTFIGSPSENSEEPVSAINLSTDQYIASLEKQVENIVSSITGEKNPTVVVTLETASQYLYADDKKSKTESRAENSDGKTAEDSTEENETGYVIVKDSSGDEKAVIITEYMPEIRGVAVVCESGLVTSAKEEIEKAVQTALGISSRKIYVTSKSIQ